LRRETPPESGYDCHTVEADEHLVPVVVDNIHLRERPALWAGRARPGVVQPLAGFALASGHEGKRVQGILLDVFGLPRWNAEAVPKEGIPAALAAGGILGAAVGGKVAIATYWRFSSAGKRLPPVGA